MTTKSHERYKVKPEIRKLTYDVVEYARHHGWRISSQPTTHGGSPQIVMVRSIEDDRRVVFVRLLGSDEHLSTAQRRWMTDLDAVAELCRPQLSAYAWRPDDWPTIEGILK